jgi:hypothetical protein
MTDIYDTRVSGDTLSHLLLLTSESGAGPEGSPQFSFCMKMDEKLLLLAQPIQYLLTRK